MKLFHQEADVDNVGDRVHRSDFMEVDVVDGGVVGFGFGLGDELIDFERVFFHKVRYVQMREDVFDVVERMVGVMMSMRVFVSMGVFMGMIMCVLVRMIMGMLAVVFSFHFSMNVDGGFVAVDTAALGWIDVGVDVFESDFVHFF